MDIKTQCNRAVGCSDWLDQPATIPVKFRMDGSVHCLKMLKMLMASKRFSEKFVRLVAGRFLGALEIKDVNLPATGARVLLGVFAPERYIKLFSALVAANRLCDREVPFHRSNETKLSDRHRERARLPLKLF